MASSAEQSDWFIRSAATPRGPERPRRVLSLAQIQNRLLNNDRVEGHYWTLYLQNPVGHLINRIYRIHEGFRQIYGTVRYVLGVRTLMVRIWTNSQHTEESLQDQLSSMGDNLLFYKTEPDEPATGDYLQDYLTEYLQDMAAEDPTGAYREVIEQMEDEEKESRGARRALFF